MFIFKENSMSEKIVNSIRHILIGNSVLYTPIRKIYWIYQGIIGNIFITYPPYDMKLHRKLRSDRDPIRRLTIALALRRIQTDAVPGVLAEAGVFRGFTTKTIHACLPERTLYLFDTFSGFPDKKHSGDERCSATSIDIVKRYIGDCNNIVFCQGVFPETTIGLEQLTFSFVMLDMDRYESTHDGLTFFYPRVNPGGYIFLHDFNSPESDYGVSRATNDYMRDKPECIVELPDMSGTAVIRKINN